MVTNFFCKNELKFFFSILLSLLRFSFSPILVIYDNDITDCFVETLERILDVNNLNRSNDKEVYIALEKRYVFTMADLDTMAPCYEYFLQRINETQKTKNWKLETVDIDFPQYFDYERSKELIIMKLYV